ncbi:MAG: VOC family protein [Chloroflexota bacterium]|jgi:glyoxylase I family protein
MANHIATGGVNHLTLTVTDVARSVEWYKDLLGFQVAVDLGERKIMSNSSVLLAISPPPDPAKAIANDRFDENRVGLDHLSFNVGSRDELERALDLFDEKGVSHGEIKDLGPGLGIYVLAFRDPDNVQLELTAAYS